MKKTMSALMFAAPMALMLGYAMIPQICLLLFFVFPPLILLCVGPFAGLLPPNFQTFL